MVCVGDVGTLDATVTGNTRGFTPAASLPCRENEWMIRDEVYNKKDS